MNRLQRWYYTRKLKKVNKQREDPDVRRIELMDIDDSELKRLNEKKE